MYLYIVGQNIKKLRTEAGMTQAELSFLSTTDTSHLGKIERGKWNATLATLNRIADALHVDLYQLFSNQDETKNYNILQLFIKVCIPYTETLDVYDPLKLSDFLGPYLFDKITVLDIENAATMYLQSIYYEEVLEMHTGPDTLPYESYGVRAIHKQDGKTLVIHYIHDITPDKDKIDKFVNAINVHHLYPIHFEDAVNDFCANDYTL